MKFKQTIEVLVREKFRLKRCACPARHATILVMLEGGRYERECHSR